MAASRVPTKTQAVSRRRPNEGALRGGTSSRHVATARN